MKLQVLSYLIVGLSLAAPLAARGDQSLWKEFVDLKTGNKRFSDGKALHRDEDAKTRAALVDGQKPSAIVLACSDSRVPPEIIFDQGLGRLFTVRVAGEILDSSTVASIEYAVEHLGSKVLVVLGHESCGAVKAAMVTEAGKSAGSPDLDAMVAAIRPHIAQHQSVAYIDASLRGPVKANVQGVVTDLLKRSQIVREAVERNRLLVAQGIYSLESGKVEFWEAGHPVIENTPAAGATPAGK